MTKELNDQADISFRLPARLAAQIVDRMRQLGWPVGFHLREQDLADTYGVSRTPIRMALHSLMEMNLVEYRPNRGFFLADEQPSSDQSGLDDAYASSHEDPLYFTIAEDRLNGSLERRCTEAQLARLYKASRARIGRLLLQMAQEGWMLRLPGHGWEFQTVLNSPGSYDQGYRYRMLIEPEALREPDYALSPQVIEQTRTRQQSMLDGGIQRWSLAETFAANSHFHEVLVSGASNPFLLEGVRRVNRLRRLLEYRAQVFRERLIGECQEHLHILDLIEAGRLPDAANFLRDHLDRARLAKVRIILAEVIKPDH